MSCKTSSPSMPAKHPPPTCWGVFPLLWPLAVMPGQSRSQEAWWEECPRAPLCQPLNCLVEWQAQPSCWCHLEDQTQCQGLRHTDVQECCGKGITVGKLFSEKIWKVNSDDNMLKVPMRARCLSYHQWMKCQKCITKSVTSLCDFISSEFHVTNAVKPCLLCYPLYCVCFH